MLLSLLTENQTTRRSCWIYSLDPRGTIINSLVMLSTILMLQQGSFPQLTAITLWISLQIVLTKKPVSFYLGRLLKIYPMIFLMTMMLPFNSSAASGDEIVLFSMGNLKVFKDGVVSFLDVNLRSLLILSVSLILLTSTQYTKLLQAMSWLRIPKWIGAILIYMYRFMFIIGEEFDRILMAYHSRSIHVSLKNKIKVIGKISSVYLTRIVERSERVHLAMMSRGFKGYFPNIYSLEWQIRDSLSLVFNILFIIFVLKLL